MTFRLVIISFFLFFISCNKHFSNIKELTRYMNDEKNGFVNTKTVNGIKYSVTYLPPLYLAMKDTLHGDTVKLVDAMKDYSNSRTFLLKMQDDKSTGPDATTDINFKNIQHFDDFLERFYSLNFKMDNLVELHTLQKTYSPVLSNAINTYGLSRELTTILVFAENHRVAESDLFHSKEITLVFTDDIFDNGRLMFNFKQNQLDQLNN
jgi:hypothetical protein